MPITGFRNKASEKIGKTDSLDGSDVSILCSREIETMNLRDTIRCDTIFFSADGETIVVIVYCQAVGACSIFRRQLPVRSQLAVNPLTAISLLFAVTFSRCRSVCLNSRTSKLGPNENQPQETAMLETTGKLNIERDAKFYVKSAAHSKRVGL